MITTITEYLGNIWRSLLSAMSYFAMGEDVKWKVYREQLKLEVGAREVDMLREGAIAWSSLSDSALHPNRVPLMKMLTATLMSGMNEVSSGQTAVDLLVGSGGGIWELYCERVEALFEQHILRKVFEEEEERKVQGMFRRKWEFVKFDHESNHYQRPLPMLTPSIVEGLGEIMSRISNAHAEVSVVWSNIILPFSTGPPVETSRLADCDCPFQFNPPIDHTRLVDCDCLFH